MSDDESKQAIPEEQYDTRYVSDLSPEDCITVVFRSTRKDNHMIDSKTLTVISHKHGRIKLSGDGGPYILTVDGGIAKEISVGANLAHGSTQRMGFVESINRINGDGND